VFVVGNVERDAGDPTLAAAPTGDTNGDGVVDSQDLGVVAGSMGQNFSPTFEPGGDDVLTEAEAAAVEEGFSDAVPMWLDCKCGLCPPGWCMKMPNKSDELDEGDPPDFDDGGDGIGPPGGEDDGPGGSGGPGDGDNPDPYGDDNGDGILNKDDCTSKLGGSTSNCECGNVVIKTHLIADTDYDWLALTDSDEAQPIDDDDDPETPSIEFEDIGCPGLLVLVNDDDDDLDGVADREQLGALDQNVVDNELVPMYLQITPNRGDAGLWNLSFDSDRFRVWTTNKRTRRIDSDTNYPMPAPLTVYLEAIAPSSSPGDSAIALNFESTCITDRDGAVSPLSSKLTDYLRATAVRLEVFDLRHWGPGFDATAQWPFIYYRNLDDPSKINSAKTVGGAITDGASICLVRLRPPLSEYVKDGIDDDHRGGVDDEGEFWEVLDEVEIDLSPRLSRYNWSPSIVGTAYGLERPIDPDGPDQPGLPNWDTPAAAIANALPQLPVITSIDTGAINQTTDVQSNDGLWFYVPPEGFVEENGLDPDPGEVEKATLTIPIRFNGIEKGEIDFILRRPPIVLVHGLMGSALNYWGAAQYSESLGYPLPTRLYYVDYESMNTRGYAENLYTLHNMLEAALADFRLARNDTPNHKVAHNPSRGFGDVRYAATRVDVVGHSMGGQIARTYVSNLGNTTPPTMFTVHRGGAWPTAAFGRGAPPDDWRNISARNYGAGAVRRLITLGSPFKGSPIGNALEGMLEPTQENIDTLSLLGQSARIRSQEFFRKLWEDPNNLPQPFQYIPPTAVADLAKHSQMQQTLELGPNLYPTGRRKVPWYPLVGVATTPAGQDPLPAMLFEVLPSLVGDPLVLSDLNPANSDLVVQQWSQRNADDENDYPNAQFPSFPYHLHTFGAASQLGFQTEAESDEMSWHSGDPARFSVGELLSLPRSNMLAGELH